MEKYLTIGNLFFSVGMAFEIGAIFFGVHHKVVGINLAMYGTALWLCGYLR